MPVASPYAVFRAADLALAPHPSELSRPLPRTLVSAVPAPRPAVRLTPRAGRPRKRLAPVVVIQGELFSLQL